MGVYLEKARDSAPGFFVRRAALADFYFEPRKMGKPGKFRIQNFPFCTCWGWGLPRCECRLGGETARSLGAQPDRAGPRLAAGDSVGGSGQYGSRLSVYGSPARTASGTRVRSTRAS